MKGSLAGFAISALIHLGIFVLLMYGLAAKPIVVKKEKALPLDLAIFQEPIKEVPPVVEKTLETKPQPKPVVEKVAETKPQPKPTTKKAKSKPTPKKKVVKQTPKPKPQKQKKVTDKKLDAMIQAMQTQQQVKPNQAAKPIKKPSVKAQGKPSSKPKTNPALEQQYKARLHRLIARYKKYPPRAKRNDEEGKVMLAFTLVANGNITNIQVIHSSGSRSLDQAAVSTIKKVSGKLPFPAGINRKQWRLTLPLVYHLR